MDDVADSRNYSGEYADGRSKKESTVCAHLYVYADKRVLRGEQPCIENVGNTRAVLEEAFSSDGTAERGPLSRLPSCHSSRMRMSEPRR